MDESTIDFKVILSIILYRIKWIIISTIVGIIAAFIITQLFIAPKYTSSISLYVKNVTDPANAGYLSNDYFTASQKLVNTYIVIMKNDRVLDDVSKQLNSKYSTKQLKNILSMNPEGTTEVLKIEASTTSAKDSADICNTLAAVAPSVLERVAGGSVQIIDASAKVASTPSSPNKKVNVLVGAALGFILSVAIVLIIYLLDNTVKNKEDLQDRLDIPVLGEIPSFEQQTNRRR